MKSLLVVMLCLGVAGCTPVQDLGDPLLPEGRIESCPEGTELAGGWATDDYYYPLRCYTPEQKAHADKALERSSYGCGGLAVLGDDYRMSIGRGRWSEETQTCTQFPDEYQKRVGDHWVDITKEEYDFILENNQ